MLLAQILLLLLILIVLILLYQFTFFLRDPERKIPQGNNIVSAADGTVLYAKTVKRNSLPISIKKKKKILLSELTKVKGFDKKTWNIVGVFMTCFNVHVNRAPISGTVKSMFNFKSNNLQMIPTLIRVLLRLKPYTKNAEHILQNSRVTTSIKGDIPVHVVQIADQWVSKIDNKIKKGSKVEKGQRIGMIKCGSQVDIIFPVADNIKIKVKEGDKVKGGSSIIAEY